MEKSWNCVFEFLWEPCYTPAQQQLVNYSYCCSLYTESQEKDSSFTGPSTRDFYSDDQSCYIMDAKSMGNIGRYLNVSMP